MKNANSITEEFVRTNAQNSAALNNAKKISNSGGFKKLCKSDDETLIFGECYGSGSKPYSASVDFSGDTPVFRCSCPSRQIPCKHCLAIMLDWLLEKSFTVEEIPDDIRRKRDKIAKKAEKNSDDSEKSAPKKQNKSAAAKKLKKQREGLGLAEGFVNDILNRGVCSVTNSVCEQYRSLAKQLGDYYLPELQAIVYEIVGAAQEIYGSPNDEENDRIISLCVRLSSSIKKSRNYIDKKLESGEVLPEDNVLYEAMGGIWKLSQLKEIGLYAENVLLIQLSFTVIDDAIHKAEIDTSYWLDLGSGEIYRTENIRPYKAAKYIKSEDSFFDVYFVNELYLYPGGVNRRVRWESAESVPLNGNEYEIIISKAEESVLSAVKKAKNELKNTLSEQCTVVLLRFDSVEYAKDGHGVLRSGDETIALRPDMNYPTASGALKMLAGSLNGGAVLGALTYSGSERRFFFSPYSIITQNDMIRL